MFGRKKRLARAQLIEKEFKSISQRLGTIHNIVVGIVDMTGSTKTHTDAIHMEMIQIRQKMPTYACDGCTRTEEVLRNIQRNNEHELRALCCTCGHTYLVHLRENEGCAFPECDCPSHLIVV